MNISHLLPGVRAVIVRTGYDKWIDMRKPRRYDLIPYLSADASWFLARFKTLKVVGLDSITIDPRGSHSSHQRLRNRMILESLVHLDEIPAKNRSGFDLQTVPIRIVGATEGRVAAYAFIQM